MDAERECNPHRPGTCLWGVVCHEVGSTGKELPPSQKRSVLQPCVRILHRSKINVNDLFDLCRRLSRQHSNVVFFLIVANPGLLIVDHIHFQYNGLLLGNFPAIHPSC